jgi:DNA-binding response OmpR family regulator
MSNPIRVLLVEDEPLIAMLYEDIVQDTRFQIIETMMCNEDALKALDQYRPDVVIVDYNLTDGPCLPVVAKLKAMSIPFVVATGYGDNVDPELGSARWLVKPFKDEDVLQALHEAVDTRSS